MVDKASAVAKQNTVESKTIKFNTCLSDDQDSDTIKFEDALQDNEKLQKESD